MAIYVTMTDTFMSGWGPAKGKTAIYCIECDDYDQAEIVAANAELRPEMQRVKIVSNPPQETGGYQVTVRHVSELGGIWTKEQEQ